MSELAVGAPAYQSLYRRFRPQRFGEVRGQDHVTVALRNAVRDGRIAHAYLFSGPRGTGKTSTARILAKALNCEDPAGGEPCGRCDSCRAIARGASFDVHELDAASSNGVDAMRDLVARAALATPGRWKVYIVDEVHMLSTAASNALLKTLEEPPEHVVFVLATTDPQKVLPTVRSRTQHYEFHLLGEEVLAGLLDEVASAAELQLPDGALGAALRRGKGSPRDALSALDQVAAGGALDDDSALVSEVVRAIADRDSGRALLGIDAAVRQGRDAQLLAVDLVERLRQGFLALLAPQLAGPGTADAADEARQLGTARCVRAMEVLGTAIVDMREAPEPRVTFEVAVVRITHPEADDSPAALAERLERLERRLGELGAEARRDAAPVLQAPPAQEPPAGGQGSGPSGRPALGAFRRRPPPQPSVSGPMATQPASEPAGPPPTPQPSPEAATGPGAPPSRDALVTAWGDHVLGGLRPKVRAVYQAGRFLESDGEAAVFAVPNGAHLVHAGPLRDEVAAALSRHLGRGVALRLVVDDSGPLPGSSGAAGERPGRPGGAAGAGSPGAAAGVSPLAAQPVADEPSDADDPGAAEPYDGDEGGLLAGPPGSASLAEESLLRAFPGAEEVTS